MFSLRPSAYLCGLCVEAVPLTQRTQRYAEGRREIRLDASRGPGVRGVIGAVDGFAPRDVDTAGALVIDVLVE